MRSLDLYFIEASRVTVTRQIVDTRENKIFNNKKKIALVSGQKRGVEFNLIRNASRIRRKVGSGLS